MWRFGLIFGLAVLALHAQADVTEGVPPRRDVPGAFYPGELPSRPPISFSVITEDGAALSSPPQVTINSAGCKLENVFLSGTVRIRLPEPRPEYLDHPQAECYVTKLIVPGYRTFSGWVHEGSVVKLYRLGEHEGSEVSFKSLSAPKGARKAYDKGEAAMGRKKWAEAAGRFEEAVRGYPDYAAAWSELGSALERLGRLKEAVGALEKARAADPRYIKPVVQLAGIADAQHRWAEERRVAGEAVAMHPVGFPRAFYYYARACYELGQMDEAVHSVHMAIEVDTAFEVPEAHYLAGLILDRLGRGSEAAEEFRRYLERDPHGFWAESARAHSGGL